IATMFYLAKDLEHDRGLACAGISDDLYVLCLCSLRYPDHCLHPVGLDAYSIPSGRGVELLRRHHLGAFQSSAVSQLFAPSKVLRDSERELDDEEQKTEKQG